MAMKIRIRNLKRLIKEAIDDSMLSTTDNVKLTWDQVQMEFPEAAAAAQILYDGNIDAMQNDDGFGFDLNDGPGIQRPEQCTWYLSHEKGKEWDQFADSLPTRPGYVLHMYDEESSISSYHGGGSDMFWTGEEWEM